MDTLTICNAALAHNGMPRITNLDEASNSARFCKDFFPICRDRVLRDHFWSFATKCATLSRLNETPFDEDYLYVYLLPVDLVRIVSLCPDEPFRRVAKKVFTNAAEAKMIYIARIDNATEFDVLFAEAVEYALAKELAMANSKDANAIALFDANYRSVLSAAKSVDTQENCDVFPVRIKNDSAWIKSR